MTEKFLISQKYQNYDKSNIENRDNASVKY